MVDAQGGFHSHLDDFVYLEIVQPSISCNDTKLSDQIRKLSLDDRGEIQSKNVLNLERESKIAHSLYATNHGKALSCDETLDDEPISIIGRHHDLTIASTPQGHFMYWKGLEPPDLLRLDARLVAYIPDLPYQEGNQLPPIQEEGYGFTEPVTDYPDEFYNDHHVYMVDTPNGRRNNELLEDISADDHTANAGNKNDAEHDARRERKCLREQRRADARHCQHQ